MNSQFFLELCIVTIGLLSLQLQFCLSQNFLMRRVPLIFITFYSFYISLDYLTLFFFIRTRIVNDWWKYWRHNRAIIWVFFLLLSRLPLALSLYVERGFVFEKRTRFVYSLTQSFSTIRFRTWFILSITLLHTKQNW